MSKAIGKIKPVAKKAPTKKVAIPNSNDPMDYFKAGKQEYLYMCKVVSKIAYYYSQRSPVPFDELSAEGKLGAWKAALNYDPTSKAKFPTFMYHYITGYIKNEVIKNTDKYNITHSLDQMQENSNTDISYEDDEGYDPTVAIELSELLDILDERSKKVLLLDADGYQLNEIGEMIVEKGAKPLSHVAVIQIKKKARKTIEDYLEKLENSSNA